MVCACVLLKKAEMPFESVILLIVGMTMLLTGVLLFPVAAGLLPYYENGPYGLLLVMTALQIIALGKTPFGDRQRSKFVMGAGIVIASAGIITCFVPSVPGSVFRTLVFICLGPGSLVLLVQMCFAKARLQTWVKYGGIFWHLIIACFAVYGTSIVIALLIWQQGVLTTPLTARIVMLYGALIIYLAVVLQRIYRDYPEVEKWPDENCLLSADQAALFMTGIFMLLLGMLLIPVNLGVLPFSGSAQLGLLMVIIAVQMLTSGNTPIGAFPRTRLMMSAGLLFAAMGIVSCVIPDALTETLTTLVGIMNILGGMLGLVQTVKPRLKRAEGSKGEDSPILQKLFATQLTMNLLSVLFGTSMLVPDLLHGLAVGVILAANGGVLLYLIRLLIVIAKLHGEAADGEQ